MKLLLAIPMLLAPLLAGCDRRIEPFDPEIFVEALFADL